jgi:hypothetical protein
MARKGCMARVAVLLMKETVTIAYSGQLITHYPVATSPDGHGRRTIDAAAQGRPAVHPGAAARPLPRHGVTRRHGDGSKTTSR